MPTRRRFLSQSSATLVCASLAHSLLGQASQRLGDPVFSPAALGAAQQGLLTVANFQKLVGSSFHAFLDNDVVAEIVLTRVRDLSTPAATSKTGLSGSPVRPVATPARKAARSITCFVLIFNTGSILIPQGTYTLDSGTLGSFSLLLTPGQPLPGDQTASAPFCFL